MSSERKRGGRRPSKKETIVPVVTQSIAETTEEVPTEGVVAQPIENKTATEVFTDYIEQIDKLQQENAELHIKIGQFIEDKGTIEVQLIEANSRVQSGLNIITRYESSTKQLQTEIENLKAKLSKVSWFGRWIYGIGH